MTSLFDQREAAGLVPRRPGPADRRARQILLTEAGDAALREFGTRLSSVGEKLLAPLTDGEASTFRELLERVARSAQSGATVIACAADPDADCGSSPGGADPTAAC
jgi:DNA-binding MarR family transcriptional regulator